jgi:hypothetical protein
MKDGSKNVAPGMKLEGGVLTIRHGGDVAITEDAAGNWVYAQGSKTFVISSQDVDKITQIVVGGDTRLDLSAGALHNEAVKITGAGSLNISGVAFTQSQNGAGVEASHELKQVDFNAIKTTVNGSVADYLITKWEILDDQYLQQGYYSTINEAFVRLGIEYVQYLEAGGEPFTDFIAKGSATRSQLLHDNFLGNLTRAAIQDRFSGDLEAELLDLVPDAYLDRPYFDGNLSNYGKAAHDAVRAFDYDMGWERPDWIDRDPDGRVDGRASQDRNNDGVDEQMFYGTGNPNTDWNIVRHEGAGVELAIRIKQFGGAAYADGAPDANGVVHYHVPTGASAANANRAAWSFDYAATVLPSGDDEVFDFKVFYDTDPTAGVNLVDASELLAQYGDAYTRQNSSNYGFATIRGEIDIDPSTPGIQPYAFGDGQFTIELRAYNANGDLVATNQVLVHVGDGIV